MKHATPKSSAFLALLILLLVPGWGFAMESDDEDALPLPQAPKGSPVPPPVESAPVPTGVQTAQPKADPGIPEVRIGIMEVRPTIEAERSTSQSFREKLTGFFLQKAEEINAFPRTVMPNESVMKLLGPKERILYNKCWVDPTCLSMALAPANLDLVLVSKLRFVEVDPSAIIKDSMKDQMTKEELTRAQVDVKLNDEKGNKKEIGEYSLFVRMIDLKKRRIVKEILVTQTDYTRLAEEGMQRLHEALVAVGMITDKPMAMTEKPRPADDSGSLILNSPVPKEIDMDQRGERAGAYTLLAFAAVSGALGIGFGALSNNAYEDANNVAPGDGFAKKIKDKNAEGKKWMIASNTLYGAAGLFAIGSAILFYFGYRELPTSNPVPDGGTSVPAPTAGVSFSPDHVFFQACAQF